MDSRRLRIEGAWEFRPTVHSDSRGSFCEAFSAEAFVSVTGRSLGLAQINVSASREGVVRGIHSSHGSPGQAKYITCSAGRILDVVVDLRPESPTFGAWDAVTLDSEDRAAVFVSEGLGHGFWVLSQRAEVTYVTTSPYDPAAEFAVNPLDPDLKLPWQEAEGLILSDRDRNAPTLFELFGAHPAY